MVGMMFGQPAVCGGGGGREVWGEGRGEGWV